MRFWEEQGKIKVAAPAKVNLFLEILGKRQDGYHQIQTVIPKINLFYLNYCILNHTTWSLLGLAEGSQ